MRHTADRCQRGFTIMELLVSVAISLILGGIIAAVLRIALLSWERAESRREAVDSAQLVLQQLREDLGALASPPELRQVWLDPLPNDLVQRLYDAGRDLTLPIFLGPPDQPRSLLISDYPQYPRERETPSPTPRLNVTEISIPPGGAAALGRGMAQRLVLVRRITPDDVMRYPPLRLAGNGLDDDGDGRVDEESLNLTDDDNDTLLDEDLAATGGLMAVTYILQRQAGGGAAAKAAGAFEIPHYILRRGIQSPAGGPLVAPAPLSASPSPTPQPQWDSWPVLARNVLYFGLNFQGAFYANSVAMDRADDGSTGWPSDTGTVYDDKDAQPSPISPTPSPTPGPVSPETMWDSTRGIYNFTANSGWPIWRRTFPNSSVFYRQVLQPEVPRDNPALIPTPVPSVRAPLDDIFPRRAYAMLVLDTGQRLTPRALLTNNIPPHAFRPEGSLLPAESVPARGFADGIRTVAGEPLDDLRESQYALIVGTDSSSYEWAHYKRIDSLSGKDVFRLDRTGQRASNWGTFSKDHAVLVGGMLFFTELDIPVRRAPYRGYYPP